MVSADRMLANAVLWGSPSPELLDAIDLDEIGDEWCRIVVAAVIVLRDEDRPVTLASVHALLVEAGIHESSRDVWQLVMSDVSEAGGEISEDAAGVYAEQVELDHRRRVGRQALVRAAHRLETATDPAVVLADLARDVAPVPAEVSV